MLRPLPLTLSYAVPVTNLARSSGTRTLLRAGALALACAATACSARARPGEPASERPRVNVLFIAVDDLRPEGATFGPSPVNTPNIDALARRGTAFTRAYAQQALCSPSRTSLLTGRRPDASRIHDLQTAELYDHQSDPQENVNLAGRAGSRALAGQLSAQLKAGWRAARMSQPSTSR